MIEKIKNFAVTFFLGLISLLSALFLSFKNQQLKRENKQLQAEKETLQELQNKTREVQQENAKERQIVEEKLANGAKDFFE